jgi:hypothetical protein
MEPVTWDSEGRMVPFDTSEPPAPMLVVPDQPLPPLSKDLLALAKDMGGFMLGMMGSFLGFYFRAIFRLFTRR